MKYIGSTSTVQTSQVYSRIGPFLWVLLIHKMHGMTVQPWSEAKLVHAVCMSPKDQATRFRQSTWSYPSISLSYISGPAYIIPGFYIAYSMGFTFRGGRVPGGVPNQLSFGQPRLARGCVPKGDPLRLRLHDHPLLWTRRWDAEAKGNG